MRSILDSWLIEPRADDPPQRVWRDLVLVAALVAGVALEVLLRDDIAVPYAAVPLVLLLAPTLLWRRTQPFAVFVACFGTLAVFDLVATMLGHDPLNLFTSALLLVALYALFRWGSGREMVLGIPLVIALGVIANLVGNSGLSDFVGGFVVLALVIAVALAIRYRDRIRIQTREQIRTLERERLARELHDTVAHHMSAIAIQAQAGRFVAQNGSLEGATEALAVIEEEASRSLSEMRAIVGTLRDHSAPAAMTPQHTMSDIEALASSSGRPTVNVSLPPELRSIGDTAGAAAYRIVQEAITNARRHGRNATAINVRVTGDQNAVHLTVSNDGDSTGPGVPGFGLIGMTERATLLGGTLTAGPTSGGGWTVAATLPRESANVP